MENQEQKQEQQVPPIPQKVDVSDMINAYKTENLVQNNPEMPTAVPNAIPKPKNYNPADFQNAMTTETDPDLMMGYEIIQLPSKGLFYSHGIGEVNVEYMTSKDEDLITTPSLIESGRVLDVLLERKIKTKGIKPYELLPGDRNAILLFLRSSSYGSDYSVGVPDPRTGISFDTEVNLDLLKYKEPSELPDGNMEFSVELPKRKKTAKFRLLSSGEDTAIFNQAEELKRAFGQEFSEYNTIKLKASVMEIGGNRSPEYINKFIDVMPAKDALTIRRKILEVQPDVDMKYEFTAKDGFKFVANMSIGIDFFFPDL